MKAADFDAKFETGEDILDDLDLTKIKRKNYDIKRVNVDFPSWMITSLDKEAQRVGVPRQSMIKIWISERLDQEKAIHHA